APGSGRRNRAPRRVHGSRSPAVRAQERARRCLPQKRRSRPGDRLGRTRRRRARSARGWLPPPPYRSLRYPAFPSPLETASRDPGGACEPHGVRADSAALEGRHPRFFWLEHAVELLAAGYAELPVGAGEVALDGLDRQVELLGDLTVRAPVVGQTDDAQLARCQRLD